MIDTHCHLTDERLAGKVPEILARCQSHGVGRMITIATTPDDAVAARALADRHPEVFFAAGIHPNAAGRHGAEDVARLREFAAHPKCVALGEMGLDLHWKDVPLARQEPVFRAQIELAGELGKPVVIHSREAIPQALATMAGYPTVRAVFHCFTGSGQEAQAILEAGHLLGFDGPLTYKKNDLLRAIAAAAPPNRVLIETDAPYLSPEPHRGKMNEPAMVRYVLEALAGARRLAVNEADVLTTRNAESLFWSDIP